MESGDEAQREAKYVHETASDMGLSVRGRALPTLLKYSASSLCINPFSATPRDILREIERVNSELDT